MLDVVREVDLEAFVGGDRRGEGVQEGCECGEGTGAELATYRGQSGGSTREGSQEEVVVGRSRTRKPSIKGWTGWAMRTQSAQGTNIPFHLFCPSLRFLSLLDFLCQCFCLLHRRARSPEETTPPSARGRCLDRRLRYTRSTFLRLVIYWALILRLRCKVVAEAPRALP